MGSDVTRNYGAVGRTDMLYFDPERLVIVDDPGHALYDERIHLPLDEALVLNVMCKGVIEPVIVRKNGERNGAPVIEVVDGRQRVRAAREANKRLTKEGKEPVRVPGMPRRGDDADLFGIMVTANELRKDDTPVVRAKKLQRYLAMGRSEEDAAITFGVHLDTVKNLLAILDCAEEVQDAMAKGDLPSTTAKQFAKLPRAEQQATLAAMREEGAMRGVAAKNALIAARAGKPVQAPEGRAETPDAEAKPGKTKKPKAGKPSKGPLRRMAGRAFLERWRTQINADDTATGTELKALEATYDALSVILGFTAKPENTAVLRLWRLAKKG